MLKTIDIDIGKSVFDNETVATMYIIQDKYEDCFIVAIPAITFSWEIRDEKDYDDLLTSHVFGDCDKRERLVTAIKEGIAEFEG
jgi:hypothetical protein